jgi:hypothetical protein
MPITRYALEDTLLGAAGTHWAALGRDAVAVEGSPNSSLTIHLVRGARAAGLTLADPYAVTDDDLAALAVADLAAFEKAAELSMLEAIVTNWADVTGSLGGNSKDASDIPKWLADRIKRLRADLTALGGPGQTDTPTAAPTVGLSAGWILGPARAEEPEF